jgi:hypothetical protein
MGTGIRRVLKPGGQVGLDFWIEQVDIEWLVAAFSRYLPVCAAAVGEQIMPYSKETLGGNEAILRQGGFRDIGIQVETATFACADAVTWWRQMQQAARACFEPMPEIERVQEQIFVDLGQFRTHQGIAFDKTVGYAFGTRP